MFIIILLLMIFVVFVGLMAYKCGVEHYKIIKADRQLDKEEKVDFKCESCIWFSFCYPYLTNIFSNQEYPIDNPWQDECIRNNLSKYKSNKKQTAWNKEIPS